MRGIGQGAAASSDLDWSPSDRPLFLQSHIFLCRRKRHWVILDVQRDQYLCIERRQFESLGPWLHGWEPTTGQDERCASLPRDDVTALAKKLLAVNILSDDSECTKEACASAYRLPTEALGDTPTSRISVLGLAPRFFRSLSKASRQLRTQCFSAVVSSVQTRKRRAVTGEFDMDRARCLSSGFHKLRLFYDHPYQCLFDSLALVNFLACFDLYPDWVFGVEAEPFEAHCWVQSGSVVLNDTVERVCAFTPIMHI